MTLNQSNHSYIITRVPSVKWILMNWTNSLKKIKTVSKQSKKNMNIQRMSSRNSMQVLLQKKINGLLKNNNTTDQLAIQLTAVVFNQTSIWTRLWYRRIWLAKSKDKLRKVVKVRPRQAIRLSSVAEFCLPGGKSLKQLLNVTWKKNTSLYQLKQFQKSKISYLILYYLI